jgi:preprotein translocase subunit SecE
MADNTQQQLGRRRRAEAKLKTEAEETVDEIEEFDEEDGEADSRTLTAGKGRATPSRRQQEEEVEEGNFLSRLVTGTVDYFEGVRSELRKVAWPSREDARRLTIIVLTTLVVCAIILGGISLLFTELFRIGLSNPLVLIGFMVVAIAGGFIFNRINKRSSSSY